MWLREAFFWFIFSLVLLFGFIVTNNAFGHSWYDPWCCNTTDCAPLKPEEVKVTADGYLIKGEFFIPHNSDKIKLSRDWDYHFCEYPKGEARCFYIPPGGS